MLCRRRMDRNKTHGVGESRKAKFHYKTLRYQPNNKRWQANKRESAPKFWMKKKTFISWLNFSSCHLRSRCWWWIYIFGIQIMNHSPPSLGPFVFLCVCSTAFQHSGALTRCHWHTIWTSEFRYSRQCAPDKITTKSDQQVTVCFRAAATNSLDSLAALLLCDIQNCWLVLHSNLTSFNHHPPMTALCTLLLCQLSTSRKKRFVQHHSWHIITVDEQFIKLKMKTLHVLPPHQPMIEISARLSHPKSSSWWEEIWDFFLISLLS